MRSFNSLWLSFAALSLAACATTQPAPDSLPGGEGTTQGPVYPDPDVENPGVIIIAEPLPTPPPPPSPSAPPPPPSQAPEVPMYELPSGYERLAGWQIADHRAALSAFARGCKSWLKADPNAKLNPRLPEYGRYRDWQPACQEAVSLTDRAATYTARDFFERNFTPAALMLADGSEGLLTGYYEPEIDVRLTPSAEFSEPILAKPKSASVQNRPRSQINATTSRVIAYGRAIDVFFMQVQGSGRIRYADGRVLRAAYAANNGKPFTSIGRILVKRGEMSLDKASKQSIEEWMARNGPAAARDLMNENARYIFFAEQAILPGEGPRGAMRVPLTGMGSIAVDNRYHPYGTLMWLDTTLPQFARDYRGQAQGILVSAQDTGSAIKGPLRGDLFFGSGDAAGEKAGVMKHPVRWTLLLPKAIAPKPASAS